jgi:hypothetical protein
MNSYPQMTSIPEHLRGYPCRDYFESELAREGFWHEPGQIWYIVPAKDVEELIDPLGFGFLAVGRAGVDSITFGYRKGVPGFWAYFPMTSELQYLAEDVRSFLKGWLGGTITV